MKETNKQIEEKKEVKEYYVSAEVTFGVLITTQQESKKEAIELAKEVIEDIKINSFCDDLELLEDFADLDKYYKIKIKDITYNLIKKEGENEKVL